MSAYGFEAVDMAGNGGSEWLVEYCGLWDIDTNGDQSCVAAVTSPIEGPGECGNGRRERSIGPRA